MLLYRILSFFWSNNRLSLLAYIIGSIAILGYLFFQNHAIEPDFNALSLLSTLNSIFLIFSLLLSRNLLYKFYRNKTHYFFAQLPIPRIKMRLYEHICFFILCALPYLIALPLMLFQVYYNGLWSSSQIIGFLSFQLILWFFFANFSLCLAMLGRLCWYVFWGLLIGLSLYVQYNKNYQLDLLSFQDVRKALFKTELLKISFVLKYLGASILLYLSAFFLSFTIDKNAFGFLHAKETSLSRGIFILYIVALVSVNFYYLHALNLSKSQFAGLHLSQIESDDRTNDYWSSSVQLNDQQLTHYAKNIARLNQELISFSHAYQLNLPAVHYQHTPEQAVLMALHKTIDSDNDLELKFNFKQLETDFYSVERDAIIEYLKILSRGWIEKENTQLYLRGLAAHWSWKDIEPSLIDTRIQFLATYPDFAEQFDKAQWLSILQNSGACLFDSLAMSVIQNISSSVAKDDWHNFILTGLNLDHSWVPFHIFRTIFSLNSQAENLVDDLSLETLITSPTHTNKTHFDYSLETRELYPKVFQIVIKTKMNENKYNDIDFHLYQHDSPGRQVNFQLLKDKTFTENTEHIFQLLMLEKDQFSGTFSWHHPALNCRVYAPWKYVEL